MFPSFNIIVLSLRNSAKQAPTTTGDSPTHAHSGEIPYSRLFFDGTFIWLSASAAAAASAGVLLLNLNTTAQEEARQKAAAITIQSFWRAVRARHLTTIQRAMFKIRQIQGGASKGERDDDMVTIMVVVVVVLYLPLRSLMTHTSSTPGS